MRSCVAVLLALALAGSAPARADCKKIPENAEVTLQLKPDTPIGEVIGWYSSITCITMVVAAALEGKKVTILSPQPMKMSEARRLFHDTLDSVGLAAEQNGKIMRITEAKKARPQK